MANPLISIIVPVYNTKNYLHRCVNSLLAQTYANLEIILVDDGSLDGSNELCDEIASSDDRITVIHKSNGGLSSARNAGLDIMTGDYVGFVDSDDWVEVDMYERLYKASVDNNAEIVCCGTKVCNDFGDMGVYYDCPDTPQIIFSSVNALKELTYNKIITGSVCDKLYCSHIFSDLRMKEGMLYEDSQIQPYCIEKAKKVVFLSSAMYCYYQSNNSILRGSFSTRHYDIIEISEERLQLYKQNYPELIPYAKMYYVSNCLDILLRSYGASEWKELRKNIITALSSGDFDFYSKINRKIKIKYILCRISPTLYCQLVTFYFKIKEFLGLYATLKSRLKRK